MRSLIFAILITFATVSAMADDKADKEYKPPPGYKTRHRGDKTIYCRKSAEIGSRFPVEKCFSEEQLKIELERIEVQKEQFERQRRVCADPALCGSS